MMADNPPNSDASNSFKETRVILTSRIIHIMIIYGREFCFLLILLAFTLLSALQDSPIKTRRANPPVKFFPESSLVDDFYTGDLEALSSRLEDHEISLIMYYAPWDASCMEARNALDIVARFHFSEQVYFGAINCWWPEGECFKNYNIYSYPVLIGNIAGHGLIRYNGPLVANYIIAFLNHLINPLEPVHSPSNLLDLQAKHEAIALGVVDMQQYPEFYKAFYLASLKALYQDPSRKVAFGIVTNKADAAKLKIHSLPLFQLHLWNKIIVYQGNNYSYDSLINWVYSNVDQVSQWITPLGYKSRLMSQVVQVPTLFLFTPRHILLSLTPYYSLMREVAMDYYNCNSSALSSSINHHLVLKKFSLQQEIQKLSQKCPGGEACPQSCCKTLPESPSNCRCLACLCLNGTTEKICLRTLEQSLPSLKLSGVQQCDKLPVSYPLHYGHFGHVIVTCSPEKAISLHGSVDERVYFLKDRTNKKQCRTLQHSLDYSDIKFPLAHPSGGATEGFLGLGCRTNRSLQFVAMDSMQFGPFAERLGLRLEKEPHQTACIIVESNEESQFILNGQLTKKSLVEFIMNYTEHSLPRHLRSSPAKVLEQDKGLCVKELSSPEFSSVVLDNEKDVVVLYFTPWCGFCKAISHVFISVAHQFASIPQVQFVRINGDLNDLPWQFTVDKYPTIMFFPAKRKSESVEFPLQMPVSASNLYQFILAHVLPETRWAMALSLCSDDCLTRNLANLHLELQQLFGKLKRLDSQQGEHFTTESQSIRKRIVQLRNVEQALTDKVKRAPSSEKLPLKDEL